jgi:hypothetical protein
MMVWLLLGSPQAGAGRVLFWTWRVLAAPLHAAANLLAPLTDNWPDPLDAAAAVLLGLLPWALADVIWRRVRRRQVPHPEQDRSP